MSQARRLAVLREKLRWSRPLTGGAWQSAGSPLLMAGLPESGARVSVWPPLSANGPQHRGERRGRGADLVAVDTVGEGGAAAGGLAAVLADQVVPAADRTIG